jgi:hypothetical protein
VVEEISDTKICRISYFVFGKIFVLTSPNFGEISYTKNKEISHVEISRNFLKFSYEISKKQHLLTTHGENVIILVVQMEQYTSGSSGPDLNIGGPDPDLFITRNH